MILNEDDDWIQKKKKKEGDQKRDGDGSEGERGEDEGKNERKDEGRDEGKDQGKDGEKEERKEKDWESVQVQIDKAARILKRASWKLLH